MFHEESFFSYIQHERRLSAHTLIAYRTDLNQFLEYIREKQCLTAVSTVRHSHIRAWVVSQLHNDASPRSVNRRLSCLKTYFKFLKKTGILSEDPMRKVLPPKTGKRLPVALQENELMLLFKDAEFPAGYQGVLHSTLLELLYGTGIRRGEAAGLRMQDVDLGRKVLHIRGKGGKSRLAPIAPYLGEIIKNYIEVREANFPDTEQTALLLHPGGEPLTVDHIYYIVKKYLSAVSIADQRSPHVLRHSFATHLSNRGADLNAIKLLLGHANLAATQIYMHNNIERLKAVYRKAHPKGSEDQE